MKKLLVVLIAVVAFGISANAACYTIDDSAIDALIESSVEVNPMTADFMPASSAPAAAAVAAASNVQPVAAFILCTFLGGFGVHRHYMGTARYMWAIYTFTVFGIFGVVPFVDWVMLIIGLCEGDISQYCGNTKFLMWA